MSYPMTYPVMLLAETEAPHNSGPDFGKASPLGLLILVLLLIAVFLLGWSMNKQLRKVPKSFDDVPAADPALRKRAEKLHRERIAEDIAEDHQKIEAALHGTLEPPADAPDAPPPRDAE
ncbi:hypothetical protein [Mycolicibacterium insubricum]|uniref:Uncharacterized protein n=1 Tax=Mycolicibacterium insubricum TaxID=444597 RepID=A0A1X0DKV9_9MYCO|nr:hypothetical protein BST26_03125 [Mycolicibacterium insubricum]